MTEPSKQADLLPCPFCGGEAEIYTPPICLGDDDADVDWMQAFCRKCRTSGRMFRFTDHRRNSANFQSARAEAIAAWNTRPMQADAVREAVERCARIAQGPYRDTPQHHPDSPFYGSDLTPDRSDYGRGKQAGRSEAAALIRAQFKEPTHD